MLPPADFDDRCGYEDVQVAAAETLHYVFFFFAGQTAVQQAEFELREDVAGEALVFGGGGFQVLLRFFDHWIEDVGLAAAGDFAAERFPRAGELRFVEPASGSWRAAGGHFIRITEISRPP